MNVQVCSTAEEAAASAARLVAAQLAAKPASVLGLPTGQTAIGIYEELIRLHRDGMADFSLAHTLNLDEFVGLSSKDPSSFCAFMERHLFQHVNIGTTHVHFLDGMARNLEKECRRYEALIDELGGIDLQLLGVGANGHIGFNEPSPHLQARTHCARLKLETRRANANLFDGGLRAVPREALSMGMGTILRANSIVLVALGRSKARAIASLAKGRISTMKPVSFLQLHPRVSVLVDHGAAGML